MRKLYLVAAADLQPHAFLQLMDNWIGLSVRFLVSTHGVLAAKDRIARKIRADFESAKLALASQTFELVRAPRLTVTREKAPRATHYMVASS